MAKGDECPAQGKQSSHLIPAKEAGYQCVPARRKNRLSAPTPTSPFDTEPLAQFNLNCLVIFAVLYEEKSVTRTSERLSIGQPAVSNSLSKLRLSFQDPLFFRRNSKMVPTDVADDIAKHLIPLLSGIRHVLDRYNVTTTVNASPVS
ncbi:LysR family transcriptional regulator [Pseudomonas kilonensis]|uniref:LysR family transcriptional regulator n=1 Tax=Pseudomonas kilonensis TaxID=132476 RepID=UPI003397BA69